MYKRILPFVFIFIFGICLFSCKKQKTAAEEIEEFKSSLNEKDTVQAMELANSFMDLLQENKITEALDLLMIVDSLDNVLPMADNVKEEFRQQFEMMPVLRYQLEEIRFFKPDSNFVTYSYIVSEAKDDFPEVSMRFTTMPVKVNDKWELTVPQELKIK